jgi:hypothetical protein
VEWGERELVPRLRRWQQVEHAAMEVLRDLDVVFERRPVSGHLELAGGGVVLAKTYWAGLSRVVRKAASISQLSTLSVNRLYVWCVLCVL